MKVAFLLMLIMSACASPTVQKPGQLSEQGWTPGNKEKLEALLVSPAPAERRVAIFDWDNTMIKNDIGDAVMFWMLSHNLIKTPRSWKSTSKYLSASALKALQRHCPNEGPFLATAQNSDCAEVMLQIYSDGKLKEGENAWLENYNHDTLEPGYAWAVHLAQGYTPDQLRLIAQDVIQYNLKNAIGTTQEIGKRHVDAWIRLYPEMLELVKALQLSNFDVWIVSASMQYYVEAFANLAGIEDNRVIGVRPKLNREGHTTALLEPCGTYNVFNQDIITYRQGKRCWINKVIYQVKKKKEQMKTPSPHSFAAGDSDTDFFFLQDARDLRLVINRNKSQIMCHALANQDGRWLINPMFILPKVKKVEAYSCTKFGLSDQVE